jgi:hypothetical protein
MLIEGDLIVELKTVAELHPVHEAQLLTYLKLEQKHLGLLINFNVPVLVQGVKRVVRGELFRQNAGRSDLKHLTKLLCASTPLWFQ